MNRIIAVTCVALFLGAGLAGCLGKKTTEVPKDINAAAKQFVDNRTQQQLDLRLSGKPANFSFADQKLLPGAITWLNGTLDSSCAVAYTDKNDRGGNEYNTLRVTKDITSLLPPGQPAEIRVGMLYFAAPADAAKLDIYVNVPGNKSDWNPSNNDEWNWKASIQRTVVDTIGVAGYKSELGIAASDCRIAPGQTLAFSVKFEFTYVKDVLAPAIPWAFNVPANASGIILTSEKAGGPEHMKSQFIVVGPDDELVAFTDFNDIAIPTESVFVPTKGPGEYVFYAYYMNGGFLRLKADVGVDNHAVRALPLKVTHTAIASGPAPGSADRDWLHGGPAPIVTPANGGDTKDFQVTGTFPLDIVPFIGDDKGAAKTLMTDVKISSSKGLVSSLQRVLRYDDDKGSLGYTQDHFNSDHKPQHLVKGAYKVAIVNDSPDAAVGYTLITYSR